MGLNWSSLKGLSLSNPDNIIIEITPNTAFFSFKNSDEKVRYDKRKRVWVCTCIHESWKSNQEQECYHIKAIKYYLKRIGWGDLDA